MKTISSSRTSRKLRREVPEFDSSEMLNPDRRDYSTATRRDQRSVKLLYTLRAWRPGDSSAGSMSWPTSPAPPPDKPARVVIGGSAGVGRTRLLREATATLDPRRHAVWSASASTVTSTLPFGSLATVLPLEQLATVAPTALAPRGAFDVLRTEADGRRIVVAIDDMHLPDPFSAALIYVIARSEHATVIATLRSGEPVHDPVAALWKDDLVDRVELAPLGRAEVGELLTDVLGGSVDEAAVERLHQLSQGNALLLRELILAAQAHDDFTESYGLWRWTGRPRLAPNLVEVIDQRVGQLSEEVRTVVELVSLGEPLGLRLLAAATERPRWRWPRSVGSSGSTATTGGASSGWRTRSMARSSDNAARSRAQRLQARWPTWPARGASPTWCGSRPGGWSRRPRRTSDQLLAAGR